MVKGVFALIGMPYSGSTILSFLLGSHSDVYNGADLHHLNPDKKGLCSIHKENCAVWTPEAREKAYRAYGNINEWYAEIAKTTGRAFICDASKQLSFYESALPECDYPIVCVLLKKHPMRSAASDLYNRLFAKKLKINNLDQIKRYMQSDFEEAKQFIDQRFSHFIDHYKARDELVRKMRNACGMEVTVSVAYEDVVDDPLKELRRIMKGFGLVPSESHLNYIEFEHHPITGNLGPVWMARRGNKVGDPSKQKDYRKAYYMKEESPIVKDDKYRDIFSDEQIGAIQNLSSYNKLMDLLGYQNLLSD